ncbi:hypothetical protein J45TS6_34630 [Paenibacillus sp. J45TS6]|uniref:hypothetical protein n=1 Tax=Paenibacillus sp. J45TS6 TaxID=2807196 RepID=UPI001B26EB8F|nr:hypothetical protein [Paenibacillus sp. J45TS6]GIP45004.1 hypothetical protein J45TS6_34630 [Paenibacillus sp. J45TS6]
MHKHVLSKSVKPAIALLEPDNGGHPAAFNRTPKLAFRRFISGLFQPAIQKALRTLDSRSPFSVETP